MKLTLRLNADFHPDTSNAATFTVTDQHGREQGAVAIGFADDHIITCNMPGYPHYVQAEVIKSASTMLDSFFDDDVVAVQTEVEIEV